MNKKTTTHLMLVTAISLIYGQPALAYLDPGTGSMLLQGLLAGIAGALVVVKLYWYRIKKIFSFSKAEGQKPEHQAEETKVTASDGNDPVA